MSLQIKCRYTFLIAFTNSGLIYNKAFVVHISFANLIYALNLRTCCPATKYLCLQIVLGNRHQTCLSCARVASNKYNLRNTVGHTTPQFTCPPPASARPLVSGVATMHASHALSDLSVPNHPLAAFIAHKSCGAVSSVELCPSTISDNKRVS